MKKKRFNRYWYYTLSLLFSTFTFLVSCVDDNPNVLPTTEPEWLGASIYDYLEKATDENGKLRFSYYTKLISSVSDAGTDYKEVLSQTGNKTLFVADDAAFDVFFANNEYGIRSFEQLSPAQCRSILFSSMLDDTYLLEMMSSTPGAGDSPPAPGQAMRRTTSWGILDSLPYEKGDYLPKNPYWERFKDKGIYVLEDNTPWTMVFFTDHFLQQKSITDDDIAIISGASRINGDAHIFGNRVKEKDVTCKNGYINVLEKLVLPPSNMAQYIRENRSTSLFNSFLERYTAPFYDATNTLRYRTIYPEFQDSIFNKVFFTADRNTDPNGVPKEGLLSFDPGKNDYVSSGSSETDMGAIFLPTDEAITRFFDEGEGKLLKDRYGSWDQVPDKVMSAFLNNHLKPSFINTVPSRFPKIEDKMGVPMGVTIDDIVYSTVCNNGVIYVTNKAYAPTEYASVIAPVMVGENTNIFYWAINRLQFDLYLLSMENEFTFFVPADEIMNNYLSPPSLGHNVKERWKFWYDPNTVTEAQRVKVTVYNAETGDSIRLITGAVVENALQDIMDNHIVVGAVRPDSSIFYQTKGGATLKITSNGGTIQPNGGGNIEQGNGDIFPSFSYNMRNGTTHLLTGQLQMPARSVFDILRNEPQFSKFFEMCTSIPAEAPYTFPGNDTIFGGQIFGRDRSFTGIDQNILFFNTFNYTVYVPTNEAIEKAISDRFIKDWDEIAAISDVVDRARETDKLYRFLRYHFQDNSVYISGASVDALYDTATLNREIEKFYKIHVVTDGTRLGVNVHCSPEDINGNGVIDDNEWVDLPEHADRYPTSHPAWVVKDNGLFNIMARDYKFNGGDPTTVTSIETSSFAVIHQIDGVLYYDPASGY